MNRSLTYLVPVVIVIMIIAAIAITVVIRGTIIKQRADRPTEDTFTEFLNEDFIKSPNEQREHYSFFLPNGLQVMLVSDTKAFKSAASMGINVGSGSNPAHRQGLAHYLEHMLFLGTENYPVADQFQSFIREHGGDYNAYTAYDHTNYFFDIKNEHFQEALARFADFFVAPLFNTEFAERERNVVDSEFHTGLKQDGYIYYALFKEALNPEHPMTGFDVGNKDTLSGNATELNKDLRDFFERHYLAKTMKLTLYSPQNMEKMKEWAHNLFATLPDKEYTDPLLQKPLFAEGALPAFLQFRPVKENRFLDYYFPIPSQRENYHSKPVYYVARLFEARHTNGLYDILNKRGWIKDLDAGRGISLPEGAMFYVRVELTLIGEQHRSEITALVLQTARILKEQAVEEWRFDELSRARALSFRYKTPEEPLPYALGLSRLLQLIPTEHVLSADLLEEYQPQQIDDILNAMRADNMLIIYSSPLAKGGQTEEYYQADYNLRPPNQTELAKWSEPAKEHYEPDVPNPFLKDHDKIKLLTAKEASEDSDALPSKLPLKHINAYFKFDDSFKTPRAEMRMILRPDLSTTDSAKHLVTARVMRDMISKKLVPTAYAASLGGYGYTLHTGHGGTSLRTTGYATGLNRWTESVFKVMLDFNYDPVVLERVKENIRQDLNNRKLASPLGIADQLMGISLLSYRHHERLALKELELITSDSLRQFAEEYFANMRLMALVHGNFGHQEATDILNRSLSLLPATAPLPIAATPEKLLRLGKQDRLSEKGNSVHADSAIKIYYQGRGEGDLHATRAKISLLAAILQPPFFQQLRTEQELGYIVSLYYNRMHGIPGIEFVVQSNRQDADELVRRVDDFLAASTELLQQMPAQEFENYKQGLITRLTEPPQSLGEAGGRFFDHIKTNKLTFDEPEKIIAELKTLTQSALADYHKSWFVPSNSYVFMIEPATDKTEDATPARNN